MDPERDELALAAWDSKPAPDLDGEDVRGRYAIVVPAPEPNDAERRLLEWLKRIDR